MADASMTKVTSLRTALCSPFIHTFAVCGCGSHSAQASHTGPHSVLPPAGANRTLLTDTDSAARTVPKVRTLTRAVSVRLAPYALDARGMPVALANRCTHPPPLHARSRTTPST